MDFHMSHSPVLIPLRILIIPTPVFPVTTNPYNLANNQQSLMDEYVIGECSNNLENLIEHESDEGGNLTCLRFH